jgi:O-succinylbenzoate synthase
MQLDTIEVFHVALPLKRPQETAAGRFTTLETILVRMAAGSLAGWGESSPGNAPLAGREWAGGVFACVRDWLAPRLVGRSPDSPAALEEHLAPVVGNQFAKAALDTAWWDLKARQQGQPLHQALGGKQEAIEVGVGFDRMESIDEFLAALRVAVDAGYSRLELKFRPGWDISMLNVVRSEFPTQRLHVDIEGSMRLGHLEILCRLDDFCLAMVEQPLPPDDLVGHAMVQETIKTPVSLDESITTLAQAEMALDLHSGQYVNLKPGRVGGLTPALAIHDLCHENCIPCWVGAAPQSALGARIGYALAAKPNCSYPADYLPAEELLADDLAPPLLPVRGPGDGTLRIPLWTESGLGIEPDAKLLEKFTIARARVSPSSSG